MPDSADNQIQVVDRVFTRHQNKTPLQSALIPLLQDIQTQLGYISEPVIEHVSALMGLPTSHIYGVATFYHQFRLRPKGKHLITVCQGTACHVKGSQMINRFIKEELGLTGEDDTSDDGVFTLQQVRCVGACSLAPVMKIDDTFHGDLDKDKVRRVLAEYREEQR